MIGDASWSTPGHSSADSLPIGNGDIAANVWTEPNGDIAFYLAKNDAWDSLGRLIKLGRLRLKITPSLTAPNAKYQEALSLADASVVISNGDTTVRLWIDAHWPRLTIEISSATPCAIEASLDPWRTEPRTIGVKESHAVNGMDGGPIPLVAQPDHVVANQGDTVVWYQRNESSIWPLTLEQQGLAEFKTHSSDPLLHRTFGGCMAGSGMIRRDDRTLVSSGKLKSTTLTVTVHSSQPATIDDWLVQLRAQASVSLPSTVDLWRDHQQWWREFWDRSYIRVESPSFDWENAATISKHSAWQRYLVACCSRGLYPVKFNGGLFTADWDYKDEAFDADYRRWGGGYWWQNTRLPYWATLASGDYDLLRPLFRMYRDLLPLAEARSRAWFKHSGAFFPETLYFWGTLLPSNYGWARTGKTVGDVENRYMGRLYISGLELVALMLETHAHTRDSALIENDVLPIARAVLDFYAKHYPTDTEGRLRLKPAQSLETWWDTENPLPDVAGLHAILPRLLALKSESISSDDTDKWRALLGKLPPLPTALTDGKRRFVPAEKHEAVSNNTENAELYGVFPFKLHGVGRPDLEVARWTFARRMFPDTGGWRQDAVQAALLGLTETAAFYVAKNFNQGSYDKARFKGFWGPNFDWIPDFDHGSVSQLALQSMLLQSVGEKIYLFPAWPIQQWNVSFKLHTTGQTVVECELKGGEVVKLVVTPEERRKDIVVLIGKNTAELG